MKGIRLITILPCVGLFLLAATVCVWLVTGTVAQAGMENAAAVVGAALEHAPEAEENLMRELKAPNDETLEAGRVQLIRYGYSESVYARAALPRVLAIVLSSLLVLLAGVFFVLLLAQNKTQKRVDALTGKLAALRAGEAVVTEDTAEDGFAFLEDEMSKVMSELTHTRTLAVAERKRMADSLADISHQLKTPLSSISMMAELLDGGEVTEQQRQYISRLATGIGRMDRLVSSLLTLSRLDAGAIQFKNESSNVCEVLYHAAEGIEPLLADKGITLTIQPDDGTTVHSDFAWTSEALLNLLKNCAEHATGHVTATFADTPLYTGIVIEDDGPGFAKRDLPNLFQRFYRGGNAAEGSAGIGLALARELIVSQNGNVVAENRRECGARFIVKFYKK